MPVRSKSNNRILPANSRAVSVAQRGVQEITPAFQTRYQNAFMVQGARGVVYNRLEQGMKCTCGASRLNLAGRMSEDGKLSEGAITEMMLGAPSAIKPYAQQQPPGITSPNAPVSKWQESGFDTGNIPSTNFNTDGLVIPLFSEESFKDDGPERELDLDALVGEFDTSSLGITDIACPVCFGTAFVGGFSPMYGYRKVIHVGMMDFTMSSHDAEIDYAARPWRARASRLDFNLMIPGGVIGLDALRLFDGTNIVPAAIQIGEYPASERQVIAMAGKTVPVIIQFDKPTYFTHFEFQVNLSTESAYIELPKMGQSADLSKLDSTDPFQVLLSPNVPRLFKQDVITESKTGRVLVVGAVTPWSTLQALNLGWEAMVRVSQPQELYRLLPKRGRTPTKYQTTTGVHDNSYGRFRT